LILPFINLGQTVYPLPKIVLINLESYLIDTISIIPLKYRVLPNKAQTNKPVPIKVGNEFENTISKKVKKTVSNHSLGLGGLATFSTPTHQSSYNFMESFLTSFHYKYSYPFGRGSNFFFSKISYHFNFANGKINAPKSMQLSNLEFGYWGYVKEENGGFGWHFSIGIANYSINGPIYIEINEKLVAQKKENMQFLVLKLGPDVIIRNIGIHFFYISTYFNLNKESYPRFATGIGFSIEYFFNFKK